MPPTVPELTVAIPVLLLLHVPPVVASLNPVVPPSQTVVVPLIEDGNGLIVTVLVILQPVAAVYKIIDVPPVTPVTTPVDELTVATAVVPLLQVPPLVASLSVVVAPAHATAVPVIANGNGLTVIVLVETPISEV